MATPPHRGLETCRRLVVKVGSQALCAADGALDHGVLGHLAAGIAALQRQGCEVVLVSSGAVASGRAVAGHLELAKQALAAVGQPLLMAAWRAVFAAEGMQVAQVLLTHADLADRGRFLHARRVMAELTAATVLPIVNENDTVAVDELKFGDNDALAAQVAAVVGAEALVLLTEVDGLYTANPHQDPLATRVALGFSDDETLLAMAGHDTSSLGTGGMRSKLLAARRAGAVGVTTWIASGRTPHILQQLFAGTGVATVLQPRTARVSGKRSWIATSLRPRGTVAVDAGAATALRTGGRSLLPIGVTGVEGQFAVGDPLLVVDASGRVIGRGLSRYDSADARRAVGLRSEQIARELGWLPASELIHRDDFVAA